MTNLSRLSKFALFLVYLLLMSCGGVTEKDSAPRKVPDVSQIPDAVPRDEPRSKYGNPRHYEVFGKSYYTLASSNGYREKGIASWYGTKFHGRRTSSGETYDMYAMTAAHKSLPLPSYAEVTNLENGRKVIVKINDRGPFHDNRLIDLSYSAASKLGIIAKGTGLVEVRAITPGGGLQKTAAAPVASPAPVQSDTAAELFLQVGAFSSLSRAEQVKAQLTQDITDTVQVVPFEHVQGTLYRVRVGPLASVAYGDSLAGRLLDLGFSDTHIIIE
ncbi:septal ring lytic transglycosylase RlpA family protein [Methylophaga sp. OBS4]|uniref:septal ring lytic transglycosylase RlpA family protein n=1 Tax=Methylophaga sp. OBS4 TaxID=2991935 RepID=UPI002255B012|nr:septal ring lytic transglycosylase RlpA family protein [Methylophaga sp. OBS4]MCX4188377.1 septal ring lytic transglycosylase RlpA family protein [Methylophaga sp. OBS4]